MIRINFDTRHPHDRPALLATITAELISAANALGYDGAHGPFKTFSAFWLLYATREWAEHGGIPDDVLDIPPSNRQERWRKGIGFTLKLTTMDLLEALSLVGALSSELSDSLVGEAAKRMLKILEDDAGGRTQDQILAAIWSRLGPTAAEAARHEKEPHGRVLAAACVEAFRDGLERFCIELRRTTPLSRLVVLADHVDQCFQDATPDLGSESEEMVDDVNNMIVLRVTDMQNRLRCVYAGRGGLEGLDKLLVRDSFECSHCKLGLLEEQEMNRQLGACVDDETRPVANRVLARLFTGAGMGSGEVLAQHYARVWREVGRESGR